MTGTRRGVAARRCGGGGDTPAAAAIRRSSEGASLVTAPAKWAHAARIGQAGSRTVGSLVCWRRRCCEKEGGNRIGRWQ